MTNEILKVRDIHRWDGHICGCVTGWDNIADRSVARYRCAEHRRYRVAEAGVGTYVDANDLEGSVFALLAAIENLKMMSQQ